MAAIAHYKLTSSGVVVTNEELLIGHSLTGLPPREQKIFDDIKNGFHRGKSPQKRHKIEPPDSVTEALDPADAVSGKAIDLVQSLLEPDLINLTTREVFDVTTVKEQSKKLSKIRTIYLPFLKLATGLNWTEGTKMTPMIPYVIPILPSKNVVCFGGTDFARFPGVVAYDAMEFDIKKWKKPGGQDKPKQPDKPKAGGSAFNFGLGISILSSSSGAANAGIGVSIMSDGVSVGTLSAGVIYDSQGAAVAVVGAGASSGSTTAAAGAAGAGTSKDDLSAGAGVAGAGKSEGNAIAGAGVAGKGSMEGQVKTQAGKSGDTDSKKTGDGEGDGNDSTKEAISKATKLDEALVKATPAQKKLLAKMAGKQKGNYSIPDQKWMEEFLETTKNITDAEVDNLADMTTGNSKSDLDTIKKKSGEGSGKDGDKPSSPDSQKDKTGDGGTAGTDDKFKGFNDSNRKKLTEATKPVASLFKAFAQGQKDDLILNDDVVTKFFEIVPSDLTQEQADKLIDGMESSKGKTPDEVIENLRKAIAEVKKSTTTGATTSTTTSTPTTNTETPDQRIKRLQTQAGNWDFSKIPKGAGRVANLNDKIKDGTISTYVYYKLKNGIGTVTEIRATVPKDLNIDKLKRGSKINLTITYTSEFVDAKGNIHKINLGSTMTIEK
ncbi:hypothetical protein GCM10009119_21670 [Algoriphagus jejuensis]|uniref:Uncharacterized protein n=1 Tax=Algoriphagus jejuensis TaxID=419934 RepID=A0ABN1N0Z9_9BACT